VGQASAPLGEIHGVWVSLFLLFVIFVCPPGSGATRGRFSSDFLVNFKSKNGPFGRLTADLGPSRPHQSTPEGILI